VKAAQIGGGEFYRAAQRAGLSTDTATLNKLVSLVNGGASPDAAAKQLAGGRKTTSYKSGGVVKRKK
jgi:hypothetical protein